MTFNTEIFEMIAAEKGCDIAFPIKEKMLIEVIRQFVSRFKPDCGQLLFGGGTSLVCAYNELTKRFSEDADFRFVPRPKTTKKIRQELAQIAADLDGFRLVESISDSHKIEFRFIDNDDYVQKHSALRPYIKLEVFFTDNLFYPPQKKELISFYNRASFLSAETSVVCVALQDTSIDKISSFIWRIYSNLTEKPQYTPSDMRHLHDLMFLLKDFEIDDKFKKCFLKVFNSDMKGRLKENLPFSEISDIILHELASNKKYSADFSGYVRNMSYAKTAEQISFKEACDNFSALLEKLKI